MKQQLQDSARWPQWKSRNETKLGYSWMKDRLSAFMLDILLMRREYQLPPFDWSVLRDNCGEGSH
jgi:hypothetical protein